jgi:hypothetical protein
LKLQSAALAAPIVIQIAINAINAIKPFLIFSPFFLNSLYNQLGYVMYIYYILYYYIILKFKIFENFIIFDKLLYAMTSITFHMLSEKLFLIYLRMINIR